MTKIDIFSGFLGAGKTTLIKKLIAEAYSGEKLVLIENEFGEINIDGGFLKESGIEISEMSAGCSTPTASSLSRAASASSLTSSSPSSAPSTSAWASSSSTAMSPWPTPARSRSI